MRQRKGEKGAETDKWSTAPRFQPQKYVGSAVLALFYAHNEKISNYSILLRAPAFLGRPREHLGFSNPTLAHFCPSGRAGGREPFDHRRRCLGRAAQSCLAEQRFLRHARPLLHDLRRWSEVDGSAICASLWRTPHRRGLCALHGIRRDDRNRPVGRGHRYVLPKRYGRRCRL